MHSNENIIRYSIGLKGSYQSMALWFLLAMLIIPSVIKGLVGFALFSSIILSFAGLLLVFITRFYKIVTISSSSLVVRQSLTESGVAISFNDISSYNNEKDHIVINPDDDDISVSIPLNYLDKEDKELVVKVVHDLKEEKEIADASGLPTVSYSYNSMILWVVVVLSMTASMALMLS